MSAPLAEHGALLGDQRIARQVKIASYRIKPQDRPDLFQAVSLELCRDPELGKDYREKIGSSTDTDFRSTNEYKVLARCVDRVSKRIKRSKCHQSIDQFKENQGYIPIDPRSCKTFSDSKTITLLRICRSRLEPAEQLMLDLLQTDTPHDEIERQLGVSRTTFFKLKKKVFAEIAELLLSDD